MKTNKNLSFNDDTIYEWWKWMHILKGIYSIVRIWSFVFAFEQWLSYTGEDETSVAVVCFSRPNVLMKAGEWLVADGLPFTLKAEYLFQWRIAAVVEKKMDKISGKQPAKCSLPTSLYYDFTGRSSHQHLRCAFPTPIR